MGNKRKAHSEIDKYSDASSGYFSAVDQTDFEDMGPTTTAAQYMRTASHSGISPMIIMNNYVIKQPNSETSALKPWSFSPLSDVVPQAQLLFLQSVMPNDEPTSQSSEKQKRPKNRVPVQNTFPKTSPHPTHGSTVDIGPSAISKKSTHNGRHNHHDKPLHSLKQDETLKGYGVQPNDVSWGDLDHTVADMDEEDSKFSDHQEPHTTTSSCPIPQLYSLENIPEALSSSSSKRKRFCNTYNILNRSGLLGITLRTKELIKQNKQSQAQLKSLQAQTDLFLEAICSGDPKIWTRLQLTLKNLGDHEETAVESEKEVQSDMTATSCIMQNVV